MVTQGIDGGLGRLAGGSQQVLAEPLAREEGLRRSRAKRRHPDRAERDARLPATDAVRLSLEGTITVEEQDRTAWSARMRAEANDRRLGGGIRARMHLALTPAEAGTRVRIDTDLAVLGKIGEFGQPVIRKKADGLLEEFARNLKSALAATSP